MSGWSLVAISVGNSRTQVGLFVDGKLEESRRFENGGPTPIVETIASWWRRIADRPRAALALASVNDPVADGLTSLCEDQLSVDVYRIGRDLPVPIGRRLDPETITGADRLLNAAAAYDRLKQACIIIDAGTAVTVDFVDGEGTFHGGAIAPGARLQLRALHEGTAALPEVEFRAPEADAFGRNTTEAMLKGVFHGIRGMVQRLSEIYAERYGAFPQIIATGGDAQLLFADEPLVNNIVPDLTLMGIATTVGYALASEAGEDADLRL
jgi:type III pantothenate kinase